MSAILSAKKQCLDYASEHFKNGNLGVSANLTILYHALASDSKFFLLALTPGSREVKENLNQISASMIFSLFLENFWGLLVIVGIGMLREIHT